VFGAIGLGLVSALLALLSLLGHLLWRLLRARNTPLESPILGSLAAICAVALMACVGGLYVAITTLRDDLYSMNARFDPLIRAFECAGWVSALAWAAFVIGLGVHWSRASRAERFAAIGFAGGTLAALIVLADYHVLTSTLNY
jgi:hypothetical protein